MCISLRKYFRERTAAHSRVHLYIYETSSLRYYLCETVISFVNLYLDVNDVYYSHSTNTSRLY